MSNEVDYYDVQNMIRDARHEIRGELNREIEALRNEFRRECDELRDEIRSLERVLQSRTEHLV